MMKSIVVGIALVAVAYVVGPPMQAQDLQQKLAAAKQAAALAWDASPISTARLVMETYAQIKDLDWSLVASSGNVSNWHQRLWPMEKHYHWLGASGGYSVGYGAPASVGAALGVPGRRLGPI